MKINITNEKIYQIHEGLNDLSSIPTTNNSVQLIYKIAKNLQSIEDILVVLEKTRHTLLEKHNISPDVLDLIKKNPSCPESKLIQPFMNEWRMVLEKTESIEIDTLSIEELNLPSDTNISYVYVVKKILPLIK
jgi:hypothetical protein